MKLTLYRKGPSMGAEPASECNRAALDFPGIAQEFLRRNPVYREEYEQLFSDSCGVSEQEKEMMARRWGLTFCVRS